MSRSTDIFIDADMTLSALASELGTILGLKLYRMSNEHETWYEYKVPAFLLQLGEHAFGADQGLNFQEYRYHISIYPVVLEQRTEEDWLNWRETQATSVFEKLKSTGKYKLMMVDDLQVLLAQHDPP
ncbi:MAG TPA: hypothetical protein VF914_16460 [Chloroflexia bacterium]